MNSNNFCHLSNPVYRKENVSRNEYTNQRKNYFNRYLKNKEIIFKGKKTRLLYSELSGDECFNKFAAGKEENHTRKDGTLGIDRNRLERFSWIFEILEKIDKCSQCTYYNEFEDNKHKNRIVIICFYNSYKIVICLLKKENEYLILSAYYVKNEKRHM